MTPETLFSTANLLAVAGWLALLALPFRPAAHLWLAGRIIPVLLAALYLGLIAWRLPFADGGFGSLDDVARLFADRWVLLAGWLHYLCFDLFIGAWICRDAAARGLSRWRVLPWLPLTFLFGPIGLLGYLASLGRRQA
jgi:hypothetical protein